MPRPRIVDFEGRQIPKSQLPNGSLFIEGVWYSSVDTLPPELKNDPDIVAMFKQSKKRKAALNSNGTAIPKNKPAIDDLSVADLLSELKRIEYSERQFRGFYRCFWDRQAEVNVRDDRSKAEFVRKYAKIFGLTYTSLDEIHEANLSLKEKKARLGATLMKMVDSVERKGRGRKHRIVLLFTPKTYATAP